MKGTTAAAFPKAVEWQVWFDHWRPYISEQEPWVRFLVDAAVKLQQTHIRCARILRKKVAWTNEGWDVKEWGNVLSVAREAQVWYNTNRPTPYSVPRWAEILFTALDGSFDMQVRLAQEIDQIARKGHLLVNVNPHAPVDGFAGSEIE